MIWSHAVLIIIPFPNDPINGAVYCVTRYGATWKHWRGGKSNGEKWLNISISVIYLWADAALRSETVEAAEQTPPHLQPPPPPHAVTKSWQANLSLVEASAAHLRAMIERGRGRRRLNVTRALICHIVSHRYEGNASRLNARGETWIIYQRFFLPTEEREICLHGLLML